MIDDPQEPADHVDDNECQAEDTSAPLRRLVLTAQIALGVLLVLGIMAIAIFYTNSARQVYTVPNVELMDVAEARSAIDAAGLRVGEETTRLLAQTQPGIVVNQIPPAGTEVEADSAVDLTVSRAPQSVTMPQLLGLTGEEAALAMQERSITPVQVDVYNDGVPIGQVFAQYPPGNTDSLEGEVGVVSVSAGTPSAHAAIVPFVQGLTANGAQDALQRASLEAVAYYVTRTDMDPGQVVHQIPARDARMDAGASVVLLVSTGGTASAE